MAHVSGGVNGHAGEQSRQEGLVHEVDGSQEEAAGQSEKSWHGGAAVNTTVHSFLGSTFWSRTSAPCAAVPKPDLDKRSRPCGVGALIGGGTLANWYPSATPGRLRLRPPLHQVLHNPRRHS